jgi:hypothetical protein
VKVSAKDMESRRERKVVVNPSSGLTGEQIDGIIEKKKSQKKPGKKKNAEE